MAQSFFSYPVTRRYPYAWFTWLVIVGGIAATAILSVINLAANGYEPSIQITTSPNDTEIPKNPAWFQKRPWSQVAKVSSTCQNQILSVGQQFYTNKFGFLYQIVGIYENETEPRVSCTYHNDYLHDCHVLNMVMYYNNTADGSYDLRAFINCTPYEESAPMTVAIELAARIDPGYGVSPGTTNTVPLNSFPDSTSGVSMPKFLALSEKLQPDLYWGQILVAINSNLLKRFGYGLMSYFYSVSSNESIDVGRNASVDLFWANYTGGTWNLYAALPNELWSSTFGTDSTSSAWFVANSPVAPDGRDNISNFVNYTTLIADSLAKSVYSTILSDLGQTDTNILVDPLLTMKFYTKLKEAVHHLFNNDIEVKQSVSVALQRTSGSEVPSTVTDFYEWANITMPFVKPATISMTYTCQVPKLKSTGSLIVSIVVADLVFLQALWVILNWIATFLVERQDPEAMRCSGCATTTMGSENKDTETVAVNLSSDSNALITHTRLYSTASRSYNKYEPLPRIAPTALFPITLESESFDETASSKVSSEDSVTEESLNRHHEDIQLEEESLLSLVKQEQPRDHHT